MFEEEEDELCYSIYENGHWEWDPTDEGLKFVSDMYPTEEEYENSMTHIADVQFKEDIDLWEQQKFKKRYQRKAVVQDVVTLQDVKDVVLFTAPRSILSPTVINLLHLPNTERFLRALILCCQYFLQVSDVLSHRTLELEQKIPTEESKRIELQYQENLEDLRLLVAKEYSIIILGKDEYIKYHHMGERKTRSLTKNDSSLYETITCIAIQIVWIALGRKYYNKIALEINRILKSNIYNSADHRRGKKYPSKMNPRERSVLVGHCKQARNKANTCSPLMNEIICHRNIDFRLYGLGALKFSGLSTRLRYLENILSQPEQKFEKFCISLGIIGLPRAGFDIMLKEIHIDVSTTGSSTSIRQSLSRGSRVSRVSRSSSRRSTATATVKKLFPDIFIPHKGTTTDSLPEHFPREMLPKLPSNDKQRLKWLRLIAHTKRKSWR